MSNSGTFCSVIQIICIKNDEARIVLYNPTDSIQRVKNKMDFNSNFLLYMKGHLEKADLLKYQVSGSQYANKK